MLITNPKHPDYGNVQSKQTNPCIRNKSAVAYIDTLFPDITYSKLLEVENDDLDKAWRKWLTTNTYHQVSGLHLFKYSAFSPGTTDSFGEFIVRYPESRVRVSRSDFILTKILSKTYGRNLVFLEEDDLDSNDIVVMSLPYSGNGSYYPEHEKFFDKCDELNIPVFIDGAYFGISRDIEYPLHRECIKDFTVSLSKNFAGEPLRLGIRFTKEDVDDGITAGLIGSDVFDRLSAYLSIKLLEKFPHNSFVDRYINKSLELCEQQELIPTNTLSIGIGKPHMIEYLRGDYVRVSISSELSKLS